METGETVQDESDNREREYWTQISESEATDAIVDAIQFLRENYTMQTDEDVPVNATSSVETSLAYGLNAHKEPKEKVLRCEYSHLPYLYCHLHNLFIFDMFLLALWYQITRSTEPVEVTGKNVLTWLRHDILRKNPTIGIENIKQPVKAAVDLWKIQ